VPPSIIDAKKSSASDVIAQEGDTVTLWCMSTGTPTPQVTWYQCPRHIRHACSLPTDAGSLSIDSLSDDENVKFPCSIFKMIIGEVIVSQVMWLISFKIVTIRSNVQKKISFAFACFPGYSLTVVVVDVPQSNSK